MPLPNPDNLARNSLPSKEQSKRLPTERVQSTIPKGGTEGETWTYPSPQMFWNSLARKGKLGDTKEEDMETGECVLVYFGVFGICRMQV
jgi:hypothetical protein